jgi:hypothetical protein
MTEQQGLLVQTAARLDAAGIPYMLAGSWASSLHGEARTTNDIDVVIAPTAPQLESLLTSLGPDCYVSAAAARDALRQHGMFNIIDFASGGKVDLVVRKPRPFSENEFSRRQPYPFGGVQVFVASPEDTILSKLEWSKLSGSERQYRDAIGVAAVQGDKLDRDYLQHWAKELGVEEALARLLREVPLP